MESYRKVHVLGRFGLNHLPICCLLLYLISPLIDAATGYMVGIGMIRENGIFSPSQIFRLLLSMILLSKIDSKDLRRWIIIVMHLIIIELFAFLFHQYVYVFLEEMIGAYKIGFAFLVYYVLNNLIRTRKINTSRVIDLCINSSTIYAIIILISDFIGISFNTYQELGSKGIFASSNGLGIFIGVTGLITLWRYLQTHNKTDLIRILTFVYVLSHCILFNRYIFA